MEKDNYKKYNYGYSKSKFYRSGPMPYWPKKKRSSNIGKITPKLTKNQLKNLINYLNNYEGLKIQLSFKKLESLTTGKLPESAYISRKWWKETTQSNEWTTTWRFQRLVKNKQVEFEHILIL